MEYDVLDVIQFINDFRDDFEKKYGIGSFEDYFCLGHCYWLAKTLKEVFPKGKIWSNHHHVIFEYDKIFFDANGVYSKDENFDFAPEGDPHFDFFVDLNTMDNTSEDIARCEAICNEMILKVRGEVPKF